MIRGSKTSKRWYISTRLATLIVITTWGGMFVLAYNNEWAAFTNLATVGIGAIAGLGGVYTVGESWKPHVEPPYEKNENDIPKNPFVEQESVG